MTKMDVMHIHSKILLVIPHPEKKVLVMEIYNHVVLILNKKNLNLKKYYIFNEENFYFLFSYT